MKKFIIFLSCLLFYLIGFSQTPSNDQNWQQPPIFEDNFNTIDWNVWHVRNHYDHGGEEPQVYTNRTENVFNSDGKLVLCVKEEIYSCPASAVNQWMCARQYYTGKPYNYTSGEVDTYYQDFLYGYYEIKCKLPAGVGFWPAFWTFQKEGYPYNEIDVFEMDGRDIYTMGTNVHWLPTGNHGDMPLNVYVDDYYNYYHKYAIEWTPTKLIWYVDDIVVRNTLNPGIIHPSFLRMNLALLPWDPPDETTPFPSYMFIDHIKAYQLKQDCGTIINECEYDFNAHDNKVKKKIIIGGQGCSNIIGEGINITLRAAESIEIYGDFYVPIGASLVC